MRRAPRIDKHCSDPDVPSNPNRKFAYMFLVGSFPFNAFLAGFLCNVGLAVLAGALDRIACARETNEPPCTDDAVAGGGFAVCLRMQLDTVETSRAMRIEDVYFDFCVASIFLFFIAISYVG